MRLEGLKGQRVGRYQIIDLVGRGGMASVYRAHDTALRRDVALKILHPQYTGDTALVERFQREAVLAAGLDHPNILPIYDVGESDGLVYIAMRLLGGQSFADVLRLRGALPAAELLPIVDQIAAALDYAHARQIVHRDIKPANILIEPDDETTIPGSLINARASLTDFGIAKSLDPASSGLTMTGMLIGTPEYMAPEQIRGGHTVDGRADVYALGVLVYRALTGRRPFEGSTEEILLGHLQGTVAAPSSIDQSLALALNDVILKALARDPDQRFRSAGEFARALRAAADLNLPLTPPRRSSGQPAVFDNTQLTARGDAAPRPSPRPSGPTGAQPTRQAAPSYARPATPQPVERRSGGGSRFAWALLGVILALIIGGGAIYAARMLASSRDNNGAGAILATTTPAEAPPPSPTTQPTSAAPATAAPATLPTAASTQIPPTATLAPTAQPLPTARPRPTATKPPVAVPTATPTTPPTATSAPPTAAPEPSPTATPCPNQPAADFAPFLSAQTAIAATLGCATQEPQNRQIAEQNFERGAMIWVEGANERNGTIYLIVDNETLGTTTWQAFEDTWQEGDPADSGDQTPPPGRYEPQRGFGKLWYANEDVATAVGWAKEEVEKGSEGVIQRFANGRLLRSAHGFGAGPSIYVLNQDGTFATFKAPQ